MEINTKFNFGDTVYPISYKQEEIKKYNNCPICNDTGKVELKGELYTCPNCHGRTYEIKRGEIEWYTYYLSGVIGKINIDFYDEKYDDEESTITYMIDSTGIGSGTLWMEDNLFLSEKEAQEECDRRNREIRS